MSAANAHTYEQFRETLKLRGLCSKQLGVLSIMVDSRALVLGFFATAFIYERVAALAPDSQLLPLTIVVAAVCLPLLSLIGVLLDTRLAYGAWRDNEAWCTLLLQCGSTLRTMCFFICTHFVSGLALGYFSDSRCSLLECLALIPVLAVLFHLAIQLLRPSIPHLH